MNALDLYSNTVNGVRDFVLGIKEVHDVHSEGNLGTYSAGRALGKISTYVTYLVGTVYLAGDHGLDGLLLLAVPSVSLFKETREYLSLSNQRRRRR